MINIIAIDENRRVIEGVSLADLYSDGTIWFWVDFSTPTPEELMVMSDFFEFHPLAIDDCIHRLQRPKLDYYDDYTFFVTHSIKTDFTKREINFFMGENSIISFHHEESKEIDLVWDRLKSTKKIDQWDHYYTFYQILDKIVDDYFPIIYEMEDKLNQFEDNPNNKPMEILLDELFDIRSQLLTLRHTVNPMRDLLYRMLNSHHLQGILNRKVYFADIYDHLLKLSEMVESNREITMDIRDSYISLTSHKTNKIMQVLTIITSIFAPLTFIAGIYGMNFEYMPELTWRYGYFIALAIMGVLSISMYMWFKKMGWFN
ncbi:magnesium/cobalt transporter CorA [Bacillus sp. Marseille-P3661]|uniref:magnesium/cobalt transporter CorA n=1 Tax=Bacillus sp. Marseille-P3661 TaxID=1936234 RepID=UPI000C8554F7|nr:magnesium/cobalt transporter CorA [Bacillus sp. Marseille-P3661]